MGGCHYHVYIRDVHIRNDGIWEFYMEYAKYTWQYMYSNYGIHETFILMITISDDMKRQLRMKLNINWGKNGVKTVIQNIVHNKIKKGNMEDTPNSTAPFH